jgi:hypothetical protein
MDTSAPDPAVFIHVKVAIGMVVGLAIASVLTGAARFVQHPARHKPDWIHLAWALSMLLSMMHFWWWEYRLATVSWRFELYLFVMSFAILYYFMCALLFPADINEYRDWRDYFMSRRRWFFILLAASIVFDAFDSLLKGREHFAGFGAEYPIRIAAYLLLAAVAAWTPNRRFHAAFAAGNLVYQLSWILRSFDVLS